MEIPKSKLKLKAKSFRTVRLQNRIRIQATNFDFNFKVDFGIYVADFDIWHILRMENMDFDLHVVVNIQYYSRWISCTQWIRIDLDGFCGFQRAGSKLHVCIAYCKSKRAK